MSLLKKKDKQKEAKSEAKQRGLQVRLPKCENYVPLGAWQYHKCYKDEIGKHLILIVDEVAELLQPENGRSAEAKEIAALQGEVETCIKSITQLGRSSGISCVLATQRNDASLISGQIQNNSLRLNTKIKCLKPIAATPQLKADNIKDLEKFAEDFGVPYDKDKGIIFESEEEKQDFFRRIKEEAELFEQSGKTIMSME